jgi:drug/metabolite transporter (DMT)-like permease
LGVWSKTSLDQSVREGRAEEEKTMLVAMILISVCLAAAAQLTLKHGVNQIGDRSGVLRFGVQSLRQIAGTPAIWGGLMLFGASAVVWLLVLSRASLSFAYPFAALTYLVILIFDRLVLHEEVTPLRWTGVILIMAGIVLVSRGPAV